MSSREEVVANALSYVDQCCSGECWEDVLESTPPYPPAWCGAFALHCLRKAGLTDWHWKIGLGFCYRLPQTNKPEPGDIAYFDTYQHHAVLESVEGDTVCTIDGNSTGNVVARRTRSIHDATAYFSIAPLLS